MNSVKVLLFSRYDRLGASSRLRFLQYIPDLAESNIDITVSPLFSDEYLISLYGNKKIGKVYLIRCFIKRLFKLLYVFKYDYIWIEKELFPYLPAWIEILLTRLGVKYVVDYDDAIFHNYDLSTNKFVRKLLANKIDKVMKYSFYITAGNDYLAERASLSGAKNILKIPTVVDHLRYSTQGNNSEELVIGWVGSPSTQKYVTELSTILNNICSIYSAKLVLVGAQNSIVSYFPNIKIEVLPWTEDSEVAVIQQFDIGIMPLSDGPWEKGKCGYKLIQYMACGKAVVASDVGVNKDIVEGSEAGLIVVDDWYEALDKLLSSKTLRQSFGINAREAVINKYSISSQKELFVNLFTKGSIH